MFALLILKLSHSATYPKTICACHTCNTSQEDCIGAFIVDPLLTTFYEDFDTARENHRQIYLYFNEMKDGQVFEFNLAAFSNLEINFLSYEYYNPTILMKYENDIDYSKSNMTFNTIKVQFENSDNSATENILKIGHFSDLSSHKQPLEFIKHGNTPIKITAKVFNADLTSIHNCASLNITNAIDHVLYVHDQAEVNMNVDSNGINMNIGDAKVEIAYNPTGVITFIGQNRGINDPLEAKMTIAFADIDYINFPKFVFKHFSTAKFLGSKPQSIVELIDVNTIITDGPTFPFSIKADNSHISFTEGTTFTGTIQTSGFVNAAVPNITIDCESRQRVTVKFPNVLTGVVSVISPYLNVEITSLNVSHYTRTMNQFPVVGAVSESQASQITIGNIDYGPKVGLITNFMVYTDITAQFTDTEIATKKIANGLSFLTFPSETFVETNGKAMISLYSRTFFNKIHGFTNYVNNLKTLETRKDGKTTVSAIWNKDVSIDDFTRYLCIGENCQAPSDDLTQACYLNVTDSIDFADLNQGKYSVDGIKKYYIRLEISNISTPLDLSKIKGTGVDVFIEGSSPSIAANFGGTIFNIKKLSLKNLTVNSDFSFNFPEVYFYESVSYKKGIKVSYGTDTVLTMEGSVFPKTCQVVRAKLKKLIVDGTKYLGMRTISNQLNLFYNDANGEEKYYVFNSAWINGYINESIYLINTKFYLLFDSMEGIFDYSFGGTMQTVGETTLTLKGDPSALDNIDPPMKLNNYHKTHIIYTFPHQGDKLTVMDKDLVSTSVEYENKVTICILGGGSADCSYGSDYIIKDTNNVTAALESIGEKIKGKPRLQIWVSIPESEKMIVHMSSLNERYINLWPYPAYGGRECEFVFDVTEIDQEYSFLNVANLRWNTSLDKVTTVKFGAVEFVADPDITKNFKDFVTIYFHNLKCYYSFLAKFKEIHITDQIQLENMYGTESLEEDINVFIGEDKNANDIVAAELSSCNITVGKGYVRLEKITFNMPKTSYYDAYFQFSSDNPVINMACDTDVTFAQFPKLTIDTSEVKSTELHLEGEWFGYDDNNIKLTTKAKTDIYIDDDMVPLTIQGAEEDVTFHFGSKVVGVYGPLCFSGGTYVLDVNDNIANEEVAFEIKQGMIIQSDSSNPLLRIKNTNIKVTIDGAISLDSDFISHASFSFANSIDKEKASSIILSSHFGEGVEINPVIPIESTLIGKVDEDTLALIQRNHTLITAKRLDLSKITSLAISYFSDDSVKDRTHGFYRTMNCLNVDLKVDSESQDGSILLFKEKMPSEVPFSIDFISTKSDYIPTGELVVSESNLADLDKLADYLPSKLTAITLNIQSNMDSAHPFIIKKYIPTLVDFSIQGAQLTKPIGYITLPTEGNLVLSFYNFILLSSVNDAALQCQSVNFTNIEFNSANKLTIRSEKVSEIITDVDSLGNILAASLISGQFTNPITISSCNFITFTETGWEMKELFFFRPIEVNPATFSNLVANSSRTLELDIKREGMTSIKGLTINANKMPGIKKIQVQFGRNWEKIENTNGLIIKTGSNEVDAGMASSPVPFVFDCDKSKVNFFYSQDSESGFNIVTLNETNLESVNISYNFTNLDPEYQVLNVGDIEVSGESVISFVDNVGTAQCNSVKVNQNSKLVFPNVSIHKSLTLDQAATVSGQFSFDKDSELNMHWKLDAVPCLIFTPSASSVPGKINIVYDEDKTDKDSFNNQFYGQRNIVLVRGDFNCASMLNNINFDSSDKHFKSGDKNVMFVNCQYENGTTSLVMSAAKKIENPLSTGAIAGIVVACVVVVALVVGLSIYCRMKKKYDTLLSTIPMEMDDPSKSEVQYVTN